MSVGEGGGERQRGKGNHYIPLPFFLHAGVVPRVAGVPYKSVGTMMS